MESVRTPIVSGAFYPAVPDRLAIEVRELLEPAEVERHDLLACVAPHAGYMYSGAVAGRVFAHLRLPEVVVLLGPNHSGLGERVAAAPHEAWDTPLGAVPVDEPVRRALLDRLPAATSDDRAHLREHSLEVMLPFLRVRREDVRVVPVCLAHLSFDECLDLGRALADTISERPGEVGIVASSDMSHYVPDDEARRLDHMAIDAALERDPKQLYDTVHREGITMCGVVPATVAVAAANRLGASDAHLIGYQTSGDVSGDRSAVVGYAGICVH